MRRLRTRIAVAAVAIGVVSASGIALAATDSARSSTAEAAQASTGSPLEPRAAVPQTSAQTTGPAQYDVCQTSEFPSAGGDFLRRSDGTIGGTDAQSEMIRSAQGVLGYLGYGDGPERIVADGSLGEHTQAALRSFQQDQGIYVDGVLGPRTWATLHDRADESGLCGQPTSTSSDTGNANVEPGTDGGTYVESDNGNDSTGYRPYRSASKQQEYLDNTAYDIWLHYDSFGGTWSSLCYNVLHNPTVTYGWLTTPAPQSRYGYSASDAPGIALSLYNRCVVAYGQP